MFDDLIVWGGLLALAVAAASDGDGSAPGCAARLDALDARAARDVDALRDMAARGDVDAMRAWLASGEAERNGRELRRALVECRGASSSELEALSAELGRAIMRADADAVDAAADRFRAVGAPRLAAAVERIASDLASGRLLPAVLSEAIR